jgi:putative oxidoreductase
MPIYSAASADPRPVFPAIARHYAFASDLAYLIVRVTAGVWLVQHGWVKLMAGANAVAAGALARRGIEPALPLAYFIMILEGIGGILITVGLFTRPVAVLLVMEFLVIIFKAHLPNGWTVSANGVEFPLMWGLILLAIALRGGGPWSLDRKLGWEV